MKYFVFDTNAIIKKPSLLINKIENFKIIIPNFILNELNYVLKWHGNSFEINRILNVAIENNLVEISDKRIEITEKILNKTKNKNLSKIDLLLFEFAKIKLLEGHAITVVSSDKQFLNFSNKNGIISISIEAFTRKNIFLM